MHHRAILVYYCALPAMKKLEISRTEAVDPSAVSVLKILESIEVEILIARRVALRPGKWDVLPFVSTHWRLYQHDAVGGGLVLPAGDLPIEPERVYLIAPRVIFGTRCQSTCHQYFVHFELTGFPAIALHDLFPQPLMVAPSPAFEMAVREFSVGDVETEDNRSNVQTLARHYRRKGIIYEALGRAVASLPQERLDIYLHRLSAIQAVLPALVEIGDRIGEKLTNSELAALCFMSRDYFIRKFHIALGVSPAQYIVERRIALATQRLLFTAESLEEIAANCGFQNRFYFTRVFTREVGIPPATYRRRPQP